jgi:general secretion pathway protein A
VAHRLTIAGGSAAVTFAPKALDLLHRLSDGIPRLINLICDRALLAAFSVRENRITPDMVAHAAESLDIRMPPRLGFPRQGASLAGAAAVALVASAIAVGSTAYLYQKFAGQTVQAAGVRVSAVSRDVPPGAALTILVGAYPASSTSLERDVRAVTERLETAGYNVYYANIDVGAKGRWQRVLAGAYTDPQIAQREADRVNMVVPGGGARVVDAQLLRSGTEP